MEGWRSTMDRRFAVAALLGVSIVSRPAPAQQKQPPTLDEILQRLEDNLVHYHDVVPSFFCDEHVASRETNAQGSTSTAVTESTFRVKRVQNGDHTTLAESREVKTINGTPAKGDRIAGPVVLHEAFSSGLAFVSLSQKGCMRYTLEPIKPDGPAPYIVHFSSVSDSERPSGCLLQEDGTGRAVIDPATLQIERIELTAPRHTVMPASPTHIKLVGTWTVAVDYAPVELEGQTFWMPKRISSSATAPGLLGGRWAFNAQYSNFHKLEVSSQILPSEEAPTR